MGTQWCRATKITWGACLSGEALLVDNKITSLLQPPLLQSCEQQQNPIPLLSYQQISYIQNIVSHYSPINKFLISKTSYVGRTMTSRNKPSSMNYLFQTPSGEWYRRGNNRNVQLAFAAPLRPLYNISIRFLQLRSSNVYKPLKTSVSILHPALLFL